MGFAKEIIRQAAEAAVRLSKKGEIRELYTMSSHQEHAGITDSTNERYQTVSTTIEQILQDAILKYGTD